MPLRVTHHSAGNKYYRYPHDHVLEKIKTQESVS